VIKQGNDTAELFHDVWRRGTYSGFSRDTGGERSTPFLESFLGELKALGRGAGKIVELGAGCCDHALRLAREGFPTTAVEYSSVAVAAAKERARRHPDFPLEIVQADLFAFTAQLVPNELAGLYANSVFHFLSPDHRRRLYRAVRRALVNRGVIAISFKAQGDALQPRGSVVEETAAGAVVEGDDGIRRLFVARVEALADEMRDEGYTIQRSIQWSVPGYNVADGRGEFVGLLARR
jgi:trans-aconitate methyltransferase